MLGSRRPLEIADDGAVTRTFDVVRAAAYYEL
jgi:hypothetical protein